MFTDIWAEMDIQLSNYVRGKTIEIFIVGAVAAIIFSSLGLKILCIIISSCWLFSYYSLCRSFFSNNTSVIMLVIAIWFRILSFIY